MLHIKFPPFLTVRCADSIISKCEQAIRSKEKEVLFDFSICSFSDPFATTLLVGAMKAAIAKKHKVVYRSSPNERLENYFKSIGFYDWGSSAVGAGRFADRQVELQHLTTVNPLYTDSVLKVLQNNINMSPGVKDSLHMSITELMTNTFDHSATASGCFVCTQAYKDSIKICLTDFGIGILSALSSFPKYSTLASCIEAIELSVKEGVSSRKRQPAGLGLTHIQRFLKVNEGRMDIISGDGWVHWDFRGGNGGTIKKKKLGIAFEGTIVNIIARADGEGFYFFPSEYPGEEIF